MSEDCEHHCKANGMECTHKKNETEEKSKRIFVCMACKKEFDSKAALIRHSKDEHSDIMVKTDED